MSNSDSSDARILAAARRHRSDVLTLAQEIAQIPSPTFYEEQKAAFVRSYFESLGLQTWVDEVGNVFARRPGRGRGEVLLAAHTDTVFPAGTDLRVRAEDGRLIGPSIGDNSVAVAALLALPTILDEARIDTEADLLLCADTGEEGLGDLRGIRRAVGDRRASVRAVIAIEGNGLGRVTTGGVGSTRLKVTVTAPGGHSWGAFGKASAIHVLGEIIAQITRLEVPSEPKTTYNIGQIEGGVSVNTIAPTASLLLDMRSVDPDELASLRNRVEAILQAANSIQDGVSVGYEVIGNRPAGSIPVDAPIVRQAIETLQVLSLEPRLGASSTDANIPIAEGIPAVCIGITKGGNGHRTDEYIETAPVSQGIQHLALLSARVAGIASRA